MRRRLVYWFTFCVLLPACVLLVCVLLLAPAPSSDGIGPLTDDPSKPVLPEPEAFALFMTAAQTGFPANLPWAGFLDLGRMERLAREDPIAFLRACIRRYDDYVKGYACTLQKREYADGKLQDTEVMDVCFREKPFSVYLHWREGAQQADRALYVEGENHEKMLIRPHGKLLGWVVVRKDPEGEEARKAGRYTIKEFGIQLGMERTLEPWITARAENALHIAYLGECKIPELGDRVCWKLQRTGYRQPEADGVTDLTIYVDKLTWLQVGSVLRGEGGRLIGEYYFRDVRLNPHFAPDQFTEKALR